MQVMISCPACKADPRGSEIPGKPGGFYSRIIGVEISELYDGILFWQCPDCGHMWPRFPETNPLYATAMRIINQEKSDG